MNHIYRLVWNKQSKMLVAVAESARAHGKTAGTSAGGAVVRLKIAVMALALAAAFPMAAHAQTSFLDFSSLNGWTTQGGANLLSTTDAYTVGGQAFSLTPAAGNSMVRMTPAGSSINGAAAADAALGLSAGTISGLLGANTTNFGLLSKSFTFTPGTYLFAWAYAAGDYQPYNDGVLFAVAGQGTQSVTSLARNGSSANDISGPQAGTLVLGSYGSTAWMTTSFTIATAGSYQVSYAEYNWSDTGMDPVFYLSGVAGTFTGTAIVPVGGGTPAPVVIGAGNTSASSGLAAGTVAPTFDGGTLDIDTPNSVHAQNFTVTGNGGTIDQSGIGSTFSGVISDAGGGALHITNSGTGGAVTFTAANTYLGATDIAAGATLALAGAGSIATSSGVVVNGTLDLAGASGHATLTSLSGNGAVTLGANSLVLSGAAGNFGGTISGSGGVEIAGGSATLSGANSYTGPTQVGSGAALTLSGNGSLAASSSVLNDGTLTIASTAPAIIGSLAGTGIVNLNNQNLALTAGAGNFSGVIAGTGDVIVSGAVQQLSGANTMTGTIVAINNGTLKIASDANLGAASNNIVLGNATLNTTGTLTMAHALAITGTGTTAVDSGTTLTANGALSGTGTLVKTGAGTLVLGGDNSGLTGGATINSGTVKLASATGVGSGAITLNSGTLATGVNLTLAQNVAVAGGTAIDTDAGTTTVLAGTVSTAAGGTGCFTKSGAGTLNLAGAASFGSGLCVAQGVAHVNGATDAHAVTVAAGAMLRGTGTVSAPVTVSGTLAPGNSPGTLTATGTVTMAAGSSFQEDINGTGTASGPGNYARLLVTNGGQFVAGNATLTPNLVNITGAAKYTPYVPKLGDSYRIVMAAGGINGRFGTIVQPAGLAANTRLAAFYNGDGTNSIDLRVLPTSYSSFSLANGGNRNAQVAGVALDRIMTLDQGDTATVPQSRIAYTVSALTGNSLSAVTQHLSGEVHGAMAAIAPLAGQAVQSTVLHQIDSAVNTGSALWADLAGNRAEWDHDAYASGFIANRGQLTLGADAFRNDLGRIGVGYAHARANLSAESGSGNLRDNLAFIYGNYQGRGVGIDALAGAGRSHWSTERANPLGAGVLTTGMDGRDTLASVGLSVPVQVDGAIVKPFVRVLWQRTERDAGSEGTAALAALSLAEYSASGTRTTAGIAGNARGGSVGKTPYTLQYSVGLGHDNGALARSSVDSTTAGVGTSIVASHAGRTFVQAAFSGSVMHTANTSSFFGVATEMHSGRSDVSLSGGLRYAF